MNSLVASQQRTAFYIKFKKVGLFLRFMLYQCWSQTQTQTEHPSVTVRILYETTSMNLITLPSILKCSDQARQQVTSNIREAIWSTSGSDYLLNHNETSHSIFVRKGMERYSAYFTHSLMHWLWSEELMKVTESTKGQRFSANDASQLHQIFGPSRAPSVKKKKTKSQQDQTVVDMNYVTFKSKEKVKKQKTPNCCENEFILLVIKYRSLIGCLHGSVFDYCLWFQSNVIYCLAKHLNKTAPTHSSACEAWRASPLSRLCWLAELQQMCINIVIKLKKKKKKKKKKKNLFTIKKSLMNFTKKNV